MRTPTYQDVNLPVSPGGDWIYSGLQYCSAARTLLVTLRAASRAQAVRVYTRTADEEVYREVVPTPPMELWNASLCSSVPLAFFSTFKDSKEGIVLYRGALPDLVLEPLPPLQITGDHARAWISDFYSASPDGTQLLVRVSLQPNPAADGSYRIRFVLAHMAVADGTVTVVADLPAVFA
jgi:hypothetical protein